MKQTKTLLAVLLTISSTQIFSQNCADKLIGKWQTEDKSVMEVTKLGATFSMRQITATKK